MIIVDQREQAANKWVEKLKNEGIEAEAKWMDEGDFIVRGGETTLLVERKSVSDLVSSILNKRLFEQLDVLARQETPFALMITGDPKKLVRRFRRMGKNPKLVWNTYLGLQNELSLKGIPVLVVPEEGMVARMLFLLARKMEKGVRPALHARKRSKTLAEEQIEVLGMVKSLGIVKAKDLLDRFQTLRSVATADPKELMGVKGIGKKIAEHIRQVFLTPHDQAKEIELDRRTVSTA